ncbi:Glutamate synthase [NADPH] large chain [Bathymodiolus heckerae thiotrophic gill symbiont]|uniref:L,D-transpeptidase n=1 Tax=Bathymodiolus heckerae thiotrophic gill symbiont TaxID=1052212 RepID=UPI0010B30D33|nr:L,D-transpeptidase [Bathymodiolus heckerae thiotrophic gill symbiont]SMN13034.1 Glutamate synthase [NADPH] large chain [Bathymodiolus heckerae thiotrophic gill symbiont]SMN14820.1 Glutamate synthase [NADPH] large chain [uncultured Candidatus Thioglobus sp.]
MLKINITNQTLKHQGKIYSMSSAKNGIGGQEGSFCTPTGKFKIAEKIGNGLEIGSVLVGRVPTDEIYSPELKQKYPDRDWILTRILWLDGVEAHNKNTKERYIYVHGSPDETPMGTPNSRGCIRLHNQDMVALFDSVQIGEDVVIMKS